MGIKRKMHAIQCYLAHYITLNLPRITDPTLPPVCKKSFTQGWRLVFQFPSSSQTSLGIVLHTYILGKNRC